jgi:hypothetical protein
MVSKMRRRSAVACRALRSTERVFAAKGRTGEADGMADFGGTRRTSVLRLRPAKRWNAVPMTLVCQRCHRPVRESAAKYEAFEQMHYVCFHYEFEHDDVDVDLECGAGGCPSAALSGDRDLVVATAQALSVEAASAAAWSNVELHRYLAAFAAWLSDVPSNYARRRELPSENGWVAVDEALRAATTYE